MACTEEGRHANQLTLTTSLYGDRGSSSTGAQWGGGTTRGAQWEGYVLRLPARHPGEDQVNTCHGEHAPICTRVADNLFHV